MIFSMIGKNNYHLLCSTNYLDLSNFTAILYVTIRITLDVALAMSSASRVVLGVKSLIQIHLT